MKHPLSFLSLYFSYIFTDFLLVYNLQFISFMLAFILVALNDQDSIFAPLTYAQGLAERLNARLQILFVFTKTSPSKQREIFRLIVPFVEKSKTRGLEIECFFTKGEFIDEVFKFCQQHRVDIVVIPSAEDEKKRKSYSSQIKEFQKKLQRSVILVNKKLKKGGMPVRKGKLAQVSIKTKQKEGK